MARICSWCGALLAVVAGSRRGVSHALCTDCLRDLQDGLSAQGLRLRPTDDAASAP